jgi:hypothetical protein
LLLPAFGNEGGGILFSLHCDKSATHKHVALWIA